MTDSRHLSPKTKTKKRQKSKEDILANQFLGQAFYPFNCVMKRVWLLDVLSIMALVVMAYVLAGIFNDWIGVLTHDDNQPLAMPLAMAVLIVFGCMIGRSLIAFWRDKWLADVGLMVAKTTKKQLIYKLSELGLARRDFGSDGVLASKVMDEPEHLAGFARFEAQKKTAIMTPIILAAIVAYYNWAAAFILLASAPLIPICMAVIGIATARKSREQMDAMAQLGGRFLDWIRGANTLSRLGATQIAIYDMKSASESYRKRTMSVLKIAFLNSAALELISALSIAFVAIYLGLSLTDLLPSFLSFLPTPSLWSVLFIMLLVPEFYSPLRRLGADYHVKSQALACAKAAAPILAAQANIGKSDMVLSYPPTFRLESLKVLGDDGRVRLAPTTLEFLSAQSTAIMGESGMGKSTILQALLGFGKFQGKIIIDDGVVWADYSQINLAKLRQSFGYLSQNVSLLPISIADNLRLANPNATDEMLMRVLADVQMQDVVNQLPQGIDTVLFERGGGLSGGQAHRLGIAQLILQDAKVWLLDEPTEHLDFDTATQIRTLLHELGQGKTVIWVTHHTEDLDRFNQIYHLSAKPSEITA
ncbi:ATP-binding cassette domain-containing protein [Moraxella nasovis]|uniref:ABC transporter ATP-binding protein/permease n=1 Tax=Moraxella nasovis TaxID=2904121 RepID=UPI001F617B45|nr:ATP-binding cassette domain-containing protein [Moraxella nasovis]UNU73163.1 ATP-binding cassette domain-containing protein [Moraxella nasovis]